MSSRILTVAFMLAAAILLPGCSSEPEPDPVAEKPVIYLYPLQETTVTVTLQVDGEFICVAPAFESEDTWVVEAAPSGSLTEPQTDAVYPYLFWEAAVDWDLDLSTGAVVPGQDTRAFLGDTLTALGLTRSEADEFITYWAPRMEANEFNLVYFAGSEYADRAVLEVSPEPDTTIRVFMVWQPLDRPVDIAPQPFPEAVERAGFTVVEWGGMELSGR